MSPTNRQIPKYYSPVRHSTPGSKLPSFPFDLHVLGMPPAFNLSQDQTLQFKAFELYHFRTQSPSLLLNVVLTFVFCQLYIYANASTHTNYLIKLLKNILQKKRIASNFVAIRSFNQSRTHHDTEYYRFWLVLLMLHHFWFCYETPFSQRKWIIASNYTWSTFIWFFYTYFYGAVFQTMPK